MLPLANVFSVLSPGQCPQKLNLFGGMRSAHANTAGGGARTRDAQTQDGALTPPEVAAPFQKQPGAVLVSSDIRQHSRATS